MGIDELNLEQRFTPKQHEANRVADSHTFTLYGGARGGGKSQWLRWYLLRRQVLLWLSGYKNVSFGLFTEDYPSLKDRQVSKIAVEFPVWLGELKETKDRGLGFHLHEAYGGGSILLRNLDDPSKYQSAEFAAIGVDELTKNTVTTFNILRGSLRWPGLEDVKFVAGTNPGGIGHSWVKSYFIDKAYPPELEPFRERFAFVPALPDDNPYLAAAYWEMLESLPPRLAAAWRFGSWDLFEGQAFPQFARERHVIAPFVIPDHFPMWRSVDWGSAKPWCCLTFARDPDIGRIYVVQELYHAGLTDKQQAQMILDNTPPNWASRINLTYADPSMWTKKSWEGRVFSTADEYRKAGVVLIKADNNRKIGKRRVDNLLANIADGKPGLQIFESCPNLIRTLPALPVAANDPEDVDTDAEDHAFDTLKYGTVHTATIRNVVVQAAHAGADADPILLRLGLAGKGDYASRDL